MSAKIIQVYFVTNRSNLGLPPLTTTGYAINTGRKTRVFNRFGQPVDLKVKNELFITGKTTVDSIELRRAL